MNKERDLTKAERYQLLLYREGKAKERSQAMPRHYYMDPASSVQFPAERAAKRESKRIRNATGAENKL